MVIDVKKFGEILISRPAGKEAFQVIRSYLIQNSNDPIIEFSFEGVKVVGPSWLEEVVTLLKEHYPDKKINFQATRNQSVIKSIEIIKTD